LPFCFPTRRSADLARSYACCRGSGSPPACSGRVPARPRWLGATRCSPGPQAEAARASAAPWAGSVPRAAARRPRPTCRAALPRTPRGAARRLVRVTGAALPRAPRGPPPPQIAAEAPRVGRGTCRRARAARREPTSETAGQALVGVGEAEQTVGELVGQILLAAAIDPVALGGPGDVHAPFTAEPEQVLQRKERGVGDRGEREPNEIPMGLVAGAGRISERPLPFGVEPV